MPLILSGTGTIASSNGVAITSGSSGFVTPGSANFGGKITKAYYQTDGFFQFNCTGGAQYLHMKTNIYCGYNIMYQVEANGYSYGTATTIRSLWCGYAYAGSMAPISAQNTNMAGTAVANNQYASADKYVVLVAYLPSTYYFGMVLNQVCSNPTGAGFDIQVTSYTQTAANTGAY